jgi:hypothetical protein
VSPNPTRGSAKVPCDILSKKLAAFWYFCLFKT